VKVAHSGGVKSGGRLREQCFSLICLGFAVHQMLLDFIIIGMHSVVGASNCMMLRGEQTRIFMVFAVILKQWLNIVMSSEFVDIDIEGG
jgi:uncharacterized YccA/Bax inhibitor family protein